MTYTLISIMQINVNKMKTQTLSSIKNTIIIYLILKSDIFLQLRMSQSNKRRKVNICFSFGIDLNSFVCSDQSSRNFILGCVANFKTKDLKFSMQ